MAQINTMLKKYWPSDDNMSFDGFKNKMSDRYNWAYDELHGTFTYYKIGQKYYVNKNKLQVLAAYYGYYGNL